MKSKIDSPILGAVIVCAGKGTRTGLPYNKILHTVGQKTVLELVLDTFSQCGFSHTVVVANECDRERIDELVQGYSGVVTVNGGATRSESVLSGLKACPCDIVVIHDGARPYASKELVLRTVESAIEHGSGVAAVRATDTVKRVEDDGTVTSLPRKKLVNMQTPQTFIYNDILRAYEEFGDGVTDDAEAYEKAGGKTHIVDGEYSNIKITTAGDLYGCLPAACRIGVGYDVHRLVENRPLILGGVSIPYDKGLLGHSDADVLAHAVTDAILSAADCPDIGVLFPDTDDKYLGANSMDLLQTALGLVHEHGFTVQSVSAVIIAQAPKLMNHIGAIRKNLAENIGIETSRVNVSATTTEKLGIIGNAQAIAASATCILAEKVLS